MKLFSRIIKNVNKKLLPSIVSFILAWSEFKNVGLESSMSAILKRIDNVSLWLFGSKAP
jgi:hypothetical protein